MTAAIVRQQWSTDTLPIVTITEAVNPQAAIGPAQGANAAAAVDPGPAANESDCTFSPSSA